MKSIRWILILISCTIGSAGFSQINHIWLTHKTNDPSRLVVNWYSENAGDSRVSYQFEDDAMQEVMIEGETNFHHVEIPFDKKNGNYSYQVFTGADTSAKHLVKAYPSDTYTLKIAFVGNLGFSDTQRLRDVVRDEPHMLVTLGDNIPDLYQACEEGDFNCKASFLKLIETTPEVFSTNIFMPILGNHDKQYRDRGSRFPEAPVYDIKATAYRSFFELPDDEWKWHFRLPDFDLCLVALDLHHTSDYGTTWQSCNDFSKDSRQLNWYREIMEKNKAMKIVTLYNSKNDVTIDLADGEWGTTIKKGFAAISGYGYFNEYANDDGFPFFNTSMSSGDQYPDKHSEFLSGTAGYLWLTINNGQITFSLKSFDGTVLYQ